MEPDVSYSDLVLHDFSIRKSARFAHMGHWDDPRLDVAPTLAELIDGQERMNEVLLHMLEADDGMSILDVGCGLGGSVEVLGGRLSTAHLVGVNIDARQLAVARDVSTGPSVVTSWVNADACAMPLRDSSFDRILCIEALPHFCSREVFFREAARVLRSPGRMAVADILFAPGAADLVGMSADALATLLDRFLGPWPEPYGTLAEVDLLASGHGFRRVDRMDATAQTAPTHLVAFADDPKHHAGYDDFLAAVDLFRRLHEGGGMTYVYTTYER
jgi:MPBQ/MSBQ methyltransferase